MHRLGGVRIPFEAVDPTIAAPRLVYEYYDDVEENNEDYGQMLEHKTSLYYEYGWKLRLKPLAKTTIKVCKCFMVRPVNKRRHPAATAC